MEHETIQLPKPLMESIRVLVKKTNMFQDEVDFIHQAIIKQMSKFKEV